MIIYCKWKSWTYSDCEGWYGYLLFPPFCLHFPLPKLNMGTSLQMIRKWTECVVPEFPLCLLRNTIKLETGAATIAFSYGALDFLVFSFHWANLVFVGVGWLSSVRAPWIAASITSFLHCWRSFKAVATLRKSSFYSSSVVSPSWSCATLISFPCRASSRDIASSLWT